MFHVYKIFDKDKICLRYRQKGEVPDLKIFFRKNQPFLLLICLISENE